MRLCICFFLKNAKRCQDFFFQKVLPVKGGGMLDVLEEAEEAVDRYGELVYRLALAQTKNSADAEDVFQEVFLRLVRNKGTFESEEHRKAWLIRVTINCSRSLWKTVLRRGEVPLEDEAPPSGAQQPCESSEVYDSVMHLPQKYRAVIHLYYYEDMPIESIGSALGIGYQAAAKRLSRARKLLKRELTEGENHEKLQSGVSDERRSPAHPR